MTAAITIKTIINIPPPDTSFDVSFVGSSSSSLAIVRGSACCCSGGGGVGLTTSFHALASMPLAFSCTGRDHFEIMRGRRARHFTHCQMLTILITFSSLRIGLANLAHSEASTPLETATRTSLPLQNSDSNMSEFISVPALPQIPT